MQPVRSLYSSSTVVNACRLGLLVDERSEALAAREALLVLRRSTVGAAHLRVLAYRVINASLATLDQIRAAVQLVTVDGTLRVEEVLVRPEQELELVVDADAEALHDDELAGLDHGQAEDGHEVGDDDAGGAVVAGLAEDEDLAAAERLVGDHHLAISDLQVRVAKTLAAVDAQHVVVDGSHGRGKGMGQFMVVDDVDVGGLDTKLLRDFVSGHQLDVGLFFLASG